MTVSMNSTAIDAYKLNAANITSVKSQGIQEAGKPIAPISIRDTQAATLTISDEAKQKLQEAASRMQPTEPSEPKAQQAQEVVEEAQQVASFQTNQMISAYQQAMTMGSK